MKMDIPEIFVVRIDLFCNLSVVILLLSSFFTYHLAFAFTNNPFSKYYFIQLANKTNYNKQILELGDGNNSVLIVNKTPINNANGTAPSSGVLPFGPANNANGTAPSSGVLPFGPVNKPTEPGTIQLPTTIITSTNQSFTTKTTTTQGAIIITTTTITSSGSTITATSSITKSGITTVTTTTNVSGVTSTVIKNVIMK